MVGGHTDMGRPVGDQPEQAADGSTRGSDFHTGGGAVRRAGEELPEQLVGSVDQVDLHRLTPARRALLLLFDQLDQRAEGPLRMDEGDRRAAGARSGRRIDRRRARGDHRSQRRRAVGHPVAHVVQPLAAPLDELGHRRVAASRGNQLDVRVRHRQEGLFHAVGLDGFTVVDRCAESPTVVVHRGLKVAHGDGHMVDLGQQHDPMMPVPGADGQRREAPGTGR